MMLNRRLPTAVSVPTMNVRIGIAPALEGTKNPTTTDATRIFEKSEKYDDRASI